MPSRECRQARDQAGLDNYHGASADRSGRLSRIVDIYVGDTELERETFDIRRRCGVDNSRPFDRAKAFVPYADCGVKLAVGSEFDRLDVAREARILSVEVAAVVWRLPEFGAAVLAGVKLLLQRRVQQYVIEVQRHFELGSVRAGGGDRQHDQP